jgi:hypothetical protein
MANEPKVRTAVAEFCVERFAPVDESIYRAGWDELRAFSGKC